MSTNGVIKLNKGFEIRLAGAATKEVKSIPISEIVSLCPDNFLDTIPKLLVNEGAEIKAGDVVFFSKDRPELKFTSPCSGELVEIRRGLKRKIVEIRILADRTTQYKDFTSIVNKANNKESITEALLESGTWPFFRQRPYNIIADPSSSPKAIFISCFDTAPLGSDISYVLNQREDAWRKGIEVIANMGIPVHLSLYKGTADQVFNSLNGVKIHSFEGKHPAGNVGVQIHHINPVLNGNDVIWTIQPQDVCIIGDLFLHGKYMPQRLINVCGSEVINPIYVSALTGTAINSILAENISSNPSRIIRGNVLTGSESSIESFLGFYDNQITVIPEVTEPEFMGWLLPGFGKLSLSRTFFSWLMPKNSYVLDTSMNGEVRNFVVTGEYEKVFPMNILPVQLLKSIMARDIETMEKLGIYEVVEEDVALCEFVCTSKIPVQAILREGLDLMRKEG
jgi:Na+-transporting NADH:ubiquinone oxidoreductase subunit A